MSMLVLAYQVIILYIVILHIYFLEASFGSLETSCSASSLLVNLIIRDYVYL